MTTTQEIIFFYEQEHALAERLRIATELISRLLCAGSRRSLEPALAQRQATLRKLTTLENQSFPIRRAISASLEALPPADQSLIRSLRDRIIETLMAVAQADAQTYYLLIEAQQRAAEDLQKLSPAHSLYKKYASLREHGPRYFRLST